MVFQDKVQLPRVFLSSLIFAFIFYFSSAAEARLEHTLRFSDQKFLLSFTDSTGVGFLLSESEELSVSTTHFINPFCDQNFKIIEGLPTLSSKRSIETVLLATIANLV